MKKRLQSPRWLITMLTGLLFAAYAAYNVFIIIRDSGRGLSQKGIFISALVAFLFLILAGFLWTSAVGLKNILFRMLRRAMFIIALLSIFALKIRMAGDVIAFIDPAYFQTILYVISYFITQAALLILLVYYIFIRGRPLFFLRASVILPRIAIVLFVCSFILELILFFVYDIRLEANLIRTVVMRPVFYLGFIGLSVYFLLPPQKNSKKAIIQPSKQDS